MGIETVIAAVAAGSAAKSAFGGGSSGSGSTSTQTIDPAMMAIYQDVYNQSKTLANQPYLPYTGPRLAGFNPDQLTGFDSTRNMFGQSMGYNPRRSLNALANMSAPSILDRNIGAYQNPYTQQVVDTTLADLDRSRQMTLNRNADSAIGANAFGGSRQGIVEAETNRAFADQAARTAAGLRQGGFDRATSLAGQDIGREINNRAFQSGLFGSQLADQYKNMGLLSGIGKQQQQFQQQALNQGYNQYADAMGYGSRQLGTLAKGAGLFPEAINTQTQNQLSSVDKLASYGQGAGELIKLFELLN